MENNNKINWGKAGGLLGILWVALVVASYYFYNAPYYIYKIEIFLSFILRTLA